jgi:hypothetical protein
MQQGHGLAALIELAAVPVPDVDTTAQALVASPPRSGCNRPILAIVAYGSDPVCSGVIEVRDPAAGPQSIAGVVLRLAASIGRRRPAPPLTIRAHCQARD